jgi:hypothetical protein
MEASPFLTTAKLSECSIAVSDDDGDFMVLLLDAQLFYEGVKQGSQQIEPESLLEQVQEETPHGGCMGAWGHGGHSRSPSVKSFRGIMKFKTHSGVQC